MDLALLLKPVPESIKKEADEWVEDVSEASSPPPRLPLGVGIGGICKLSHKITS